MADGREETDLPKINLKLLKALISGAEFHMGTRAIGDIFQNPPKNYFPSNYQEVARFLDTEICQTTKSHINECLVSLSGWLKSWSATRIANALPPTHHYPELLEAVTTTDELIAKIQTDAPSALGLFTIVANVHLILLQETSAVDPDTHQEASTSKHIKELKKFAKSYIAYTQAIYDQLAASRTSTISSGVFKSCEPTDAIVHGRFADYKMSVWWSDLYMGLVSKNSITYTHDRYTDMHTDVDTLDLWFECPESSNLLKQKEKEREEYVRKVVTDLARSLNNPIDTIHTWRRLERQPLPSVPMTQSSD